MTVLTRRSIATARHTTAWLEAGPGDGPLLIFVHGWPELSVLWRAQLEAFAQAGWRCVAPDMRGYGGSSVPDTAAAYAVRELVEDMIELHEALGGAPAVWVGHDWGCAVAWALASHHAARCRGVIGMCVPYLARGLALPVLVPLVDRELYPEDRYPVGQWDYWLGHREHFARTVSDFEADPRATIAALYRAAPAGAGEQPAPLASVRARGGWFGDARRAPDLPRDDTLLNEADFDTVVEAFRRTGFAGADAWYLNDAPNMAYAAEAPDFGRLTLPVLFLHAARDSVCRTVHGPLADPMREDCADLTEITIDAGHALMLERADEVNAAMSEWLSRFSK